MMDELDLCKSSAIEKFQNLLLSTKSNNEIEKLFRNFTSTNTLNELITNQIYKIATDDQYVTPNISGKMSYVIFDNDRFTYALQFIIPGVKADKDIVWDSYFQLLSFKGQGRLNIRKLKVSGNEDINSFKPDVLLEIIKDEIYTEGGFVCNWDDHCLMEIHEIFSPVLIESLTIKNNYAEFRWTFNDNLLSVGTKASKILLVRLLTILNLGLSMEVNVPEILYKTIFLIGDPFLKISAIEGLLLEGKDDGFDKLDEAIQSSNTLFSHLAKNLHQKLANY
jgi:hypothetical protein